MEGIAAWIARISWPIVTRVLSAMGVGTITYVGANTALQQGLQAAKTAFAGLAGDVAQLLAMAGFFDFMSITSGGIMSGLAWMVLKRFAIQSGTQ
ncbi:hypothetical protein D3C86_2051900 [compost metagenome]